MRIRYNQVSNDDRPWNPSIPRKTANQVSCTTSSATAWFGTNERATRTSQKLDHSSALYFTTTVFSTVGFGDITPLTDAARLTVSAQMIIDLVIIGVVVRLLINAAKMGLECAHEPPCD